MVSITDRSFFLSFFSFFLVITIMPCHDDTIDSMSSSSSSFFLQYHMDICPFYMSERKKEDIPPPFPTFLVGLDHNAPFVFSRIRQVSNTVKEPLFAIMELTFIYFFHFYFLSCFLSSFSFASLPFPSLPSLPPRRHSSSLLLCSLSFPFLSSLCSRPSPRLPSHLFLVPSFSPLHAHRQHRPPGFGLLPFVLILRSRLGFVRFGVRLPCAHACSGRDI